MFWPKNHTPWATLGSLPAISKIWIPLENAKIENASTGGLWGVYPEVLVALAQNS